MPWLQVVTESEPPLERYYRHISKGAWPFSSRDHGWPIADCTSEGLKVGSSVQGASMSVVQSVWVWVIVSATQGGQSRVLVLQERARVPGAAIGTSARVHALQLARPQMAHCRLHQ